LGGFHGAQRDPDAQPLAQSKQAGSVVYHEKGWKTFAAT
ncbi:hypothetical protein LCGC14_2998910, partial [marine sediment metagenome]